MVLNDVKLIFTSENKIKNIGYRPLEKAVS